MSNVNENSLPRSEADAQAAKQPAKKKSQNKGGGFGRFLRRTLLVIFTLLILAAVGLAMFLNTIFNGPSETARDALTLALSKDAATDWIPGIFLGEEVAAEILSEGITLPNSDE